jgi:hypothetical protein
MGAEPKVHKACDDYMVQDMFSRRGHSESVRLACPHRNTRVVCIEALDTRLIKVSVNKGV